jgi:signal transduction histidine kinase
VRDYGTGIPQARQEELFLQFSRLDHTTAEGHGLGLSIVKRIVERLGGEVGYAAGTEAPLSSLPTDEITTEFLSTSGSCFWFTLPLTAPEKN